MKKFIATISYKGIFTGGSRIYGIDATTKTEAKKRANETAEKHYSGWDEVVVTVEELTTKKKLALRQALAQVEEEYRRIARVRDMLKACVDTANRYRNFDD